MTAIAYASVEFILLKSALRCLAPALVVSCVVSCASEPPPAPTLSALAPANVQPKAGAPRPDEGQRTQLALPFEGIWVVGQGYHGGESHHGNAAYALDLVKLGADGQAYVRQGKRTKDWYGFGAEVLAAADGVVVRAIDEFPDNRVLGQATDTNTLIVRHGPAEFSEYVHLQHRSLRVHVGEQVKRGQVLARCGNSGSATPHLHWALLSSFEPIQTRPAVFSDYEVQDERGLWQAARNTPRSGDVIRQRSPGPEATPGNQ